MGSGYLLGQALVNAHLLRDLGPARDHLTDLREDALGATAWQTGDNEPGRLRMSMLQYEHAS